MAIQRSRLCVGCGKRTLHHKAEGVSQGMGCLLTILSGGLFLILWVPLLIVNSLEKPVCQICGTKN